MDTQNISPTEIEKELIASYSFPTKEVLSSVEAMDERKKSLLRATTLGNGQKNKVKIIFEDIEGIKQVETTIWGVTEDRIILKQNMVIPIRCIHKIKF